MPRPPALGTDSSLQKLMVRWATVCAYDEDGDDDGDDDDDDDDVDGGDWLLANGVYALQ